jgi:hypothetical protein
MMIDAVKLAKNELIKQQGVPLDKHQRFYFDTSELVGPLEEFCSKPGQCLELPALSNCIMPLIFWSRENESFLKDALLFSMQHQYLQNGDIMVDPRMELFCFPEHHVVGVMSFEQSNPPIYSQVYYNDGAAISVNTKKSLESFLAMWLRNIKHYHYATYSQRKHKTFQSLSD